ncbi:MAG: TolC family protein [Planctomycetes bacterium]|nr:TolC family protein [Planctomycetota bacterium]
MSRGGGLPAVVVALGALLALLGGGCADRARRSYQEEVVNDLPGAPAEPEDQVEAAGAMRALAEAAAVSTQLTLTDCMRLALVNVQRLEARGERLLQADTLRAEAITTLLPRAGFSLRYTRDSNPVEFGGEVFLPQTRLEHSVFVTQPLFDARALPGYRLGAATRRVEALLLDDERDEVLFQVAAAFYEVLGFDRDLVFLRSTRDQVDEQLRVLEARLEVGEAQPQEVLLARARRAEVEVDLVQAQFDRDSARARLARLTGTSAQQELLDTLEVERPRGSVEALVARALATRPALEAARAEVDVAAERRNLVLAEYLPRVTLDFTYFTRAVGGFNQFLDWTGSINLLWTVFDGGSREVRLARTRSIERERALLARDLEDEVRLQVVQAALSFAALDRAQDALEARRQAARGAQELASVQFQAGEATNLDVLVAVAERQDAERNQVRGEFARKLAALRIWLVTGELSRSPPARRLLERRR